MPIFELYKAMSVKMDSKEYLNKKFQKDFFRYTILRQDGLSADEIASSFEITARGAVGSGGDLMHMLRDMASNESHRIIDEEFSFERIKENGAFVSSIPDGFGPELIGKAVDRLNLYMQSDMLASLERKVADQLVGRIEKNAWRSGLGNLTAGIGLFVESTRRKAQGYLSAVSASGWKAEVDAAMEKASSRRSKVDDIIALRSALRDAAAQECENVIYRHAAGFLKSVADNKVILDIASNAARVEKLARERFEALETLRDDPMLDAVYDKLVPVGFYTRNIEKVDASKAFYMILMQMLARKEDELMTRGWLVDGEIRIFTKQPLDTPETIIDGIVGLTSLDAF